MNVSLVTSHFPLLITCNEFWLGKSLADLGYKVNIVTTSVKSPRELRNSKKVCETDIKNFKVNYVPTLINFQLNPIVYGISEYMQESEVVILTEDYWFICHKAFHECKKKKIPTILTTERTNWPENFFT